MKTINVKQINGNFYGGFPYNINWSFNGGDSPSTLTVDVVNENGLYGNPQLSFNNIEKITFDTFEFNGYLVSYNMSNKVDQKTLTLEYVDTSINLDKYFVVLNTKHADRNKSYSRSLITVGKPYHPCDRNMDSLVDNINENGRDVDFCDPCPFMPIDKYARTCAPERSNFDIFPVAYTFNELLSKMPIEYTISSSRFNDKFLKRSHVGALKSVLSSWCEDLGMSYYWDPIQNKLFFIDRTVPLEIPSFDKNDPDIVEFNMGANIQNTFSRGYIGIYEKEGSFQTYNCENETIETLQCLTIQDLYDTSSSGGSNSKAPSVADVEELLTAVSYLGIPAHNAFTWFWLYEIVNASAAEKFKVENANDDGKRYLRYFGNMKIKAVYSKNSEDPESRGKFDTCKSKISREKFAALKAEEAARGFSDDSPGYYFIIADYNEEFFNKQVQDRMDKAQNFFGKHWYKKFNAGYRIPGASSNNGQVEVATPDGDSAKWYRISESAEGLKIFSFGHEEKSKVGKLFNDIPNNQLENELNERSYWNQIATFGPESSDIRKAAKSFILMERNTKWYPDSRALIHYESLFAWYKDRSPQVFDTSDGRPNWLFTLYPEAKNNSNIRVFICRDLTKEPDGAFDSVEFSTTDHPLEPKKREQYSEDDQDANGRTIKIKKGPYGLNGRKCVKIKLPGIDLYCPVQAFGNNQIIEDGYRSATSQEQSDDLTRDLTGTTVELGTDDGTAGYRVFVKTSANFSKTLPKLQYSFHQSPPYSNVAKIDYAIHDLSSERNMDNLQRQRCIISNNNFNRYASQFANYMAMGQQDAQRKISFKMAGIFPKKYTVANGLSSVNISVDDDGVYTTYQFEDSIIIPPNEQTISEIIESRTSIGSQTQLTPKQLRSMRTAVSISRQAGSNLY